MSDYTVQGNRLLPLHNLNTSAVTPHSSIQSITMSIRFGSQKFAIGYIQKFDFEMSREAKTIYQIEAYPDIRGDDGAPSGIASTFTPRNFDENTTYWPGEAIEVIPGKMGEITINLSRYSLYTGNLLAAVTRATGSGVYDGNAVAPNLMESDVAIIKYINILQQVRPFDIYQVFASPVSGGTLWGRKFGGCWFTKIGEKVPEADKNEPILEDATLKCTYIRPLSSSIGR